MFDKCNVVDIFTEPKISFSDIYDFSFSERCTNLCEKNDVMGESNVKQVRKGILKVIVTVKSGCLQIGFRPLIIDYICNFCYLTPLTPVNQI